MLIVEKEVAGLKPCREAPRCDETTLSFAMDSIRKYGVTVPVIIDSDNVIIAGATRVRAAKALGIRSVPCIVDKA